MCVRCWRGADRELIVPGRVLAKRAVRIHNIVPD